MCWRQGGPLGGFPDTAASPAPCQPPRSCEPKGLKEQLVLKTQIFFSKSLPGKTGKAVKEPVNRLTEMQHLEQTDITEGGFLFLFFLPYPGERKGIKEVGANW